MGFRFRRSIKILPGVKINVSKSGVSTSIGGKGCTVNIGHGKVKTTVGLPGTGLSYSTSTSYRNKVNSNANIQPEQKQQCLVMTEEEYELYQAELKAESKKLRRKETIKFFALALLITAFVIYYYS